MKKLSLLKLEKILPEICDRKTAYCAREWTEDNPLWGHCAVVALLVQEIFGGELLRVSLEGTPFAKARYHYWNRLPDGTEVDLTRIQFAGKFPEGLKAVVRKSKDLLRIEQVAKRFKLLKRRLKIFLGRP